MTIEEVMNKLRSYSKSTAYTEREAGKREAYEHTLYLLEAVTPNEKHIVMEPLIVTPETISNVWSGGQEVATSLEMAPGIKQLKEKAREYHLLELNDIVKEQVEEAVQREHAPDFEELLDNLNAKADRLLSEEFEIPRGKPKPRRKKNEN